MTAIGAQAPLFAAVTGSGSSSPTVTWSSSAPTVATVSSAGVVTSVGNGTATITATANNVQGSATVTVAQTINSVVVTPAVDTIAAIGGTEQLTAFARDANNSPVASATLTYASSAPTVATVSASGLVTAVASGTTTITVSAGSISATATIVVLQVPATVAVTPTPVSLTAVGATQQLSAEVRDASNNVMSGAAVTWASATPTVATVSASGLVTAVANGTATITATAGSASGTSAVTVAQQVATIAVTPSSDTLTAVGATQQFTATARDANSNAVAGATITWASAAPAVATVNASGLATAVSNGSSTITASVGSVSATASLLVAQAAATVQVTPATATLSTLGATQQLTASVRDANSNAIAGATVTWSSSATGVATVNTSGLVTAVANGTATITATSGGQSATATITVTSTPVATTVTIAPTSVSISALGATSQLTATVRDASNAVITGATVTWSSSSNAIATVSSSGLVTAVANGTATITATSGSASATRTVTVAQTVSTVSVTPSTATIVRDGATQQLAAVARDSRSNIISGRTFTWTSSNTAVASVNSSGLVTSAAPGTATITATTGGVSSTATITVSGVAMAWVHVTQASATTQYTPASTEATNLSGGTITVARFETGKYAVVFGGLGTNTGRIGARWTALVSTSLFQSGGLPVQGAVCNLNNLQVTELRVDVWCENAVSGAAMDAQFRVLVVANNVLDNHHAFTSHSNSALTTTTTYTPTTTLSYNSSNAAMSVALNATTNEVVHSFGAAVASTVGVFAQAITPLIGSARSCTVRGHSATTRQATIWCFNAAGTRDRTITHTFLAADRGRPSGFYGRAAVNANGTLQSSASSANQSATATRVGVGSYTVVFNGLASPNADGNFAVLVSPAGGSGWENCGHRVYNSNPISLQIVCVNQNGTQVDVGAAFHVMVLR